MIVWEGCRLEFDDYVRLRGAAMVRLARLLTGDRGAGEDLAQDVLARAFVRWERITKTGSPEAYLRQMLVNASISRWRRLSSREVPVATAGDEVVVGDFGADVAQRDALWRVVRELPPRQRAVVVLRFYEDLDDASIAAIMHCSAVTVRTQVMRALTTLRSRMDASAETTSLRSTP
jgi:RNA polymerase sigma-70 factor (sigma-E family)